MVPAPFVTFVVALEAAILGWVFPVLSDFPLQTRRLNGTEFANHRYQKSTHEGLGAVQL
jgi:hypothetical protein